MIDLPINPKTGKHDGIYYTFGGSECCIVLAHKLLPNAVKMRKVTSSLSHYTDGLRTLALLPKTSPMRTAICQDWLSKYLDIFTNLLTVEEGQTFLINIARARYRDMLVRI